MSTYAEKLKHPLWQRKRLEIARVRQAIYRTQQALNAMLMRLEGMAKPIIRTHGGGDA